MDDLDDLEQTLDAWGNAPSKTGDTLIPGLLLRALAAIRELRKEGPLRAAHRVTPQQIAEAGAKALRDMRAKNPGPVVSAADILGTLPTPGRSADS